MPWYCIFAAPAHGSHQIRPTPFGNQGTHPARGQEALPQRTHGPAGAKPTAVKKGLGAVNQGLRWFEPSTPCWNLKHGFFHSWKPLNLVVDNQRWRLLKRLQGNIAPKGERLNKIPFSALVKVMESNNRHPIRMRSFKISYLRCREEKIHIFVGEAWGFMAPSSQLFSGLFCDEWEDMAKQHFIPLLA